MSSNLLKLVLTSFLISLLGLGIGYVWMQHHLDKPVVIQTSNQLDEGRLLWTIERGSNLSRVTAQLNEHKIIESPALVKK